MAVVAAKDLEGEFGRLRLAFLVVSMTATLGTVISERGEAFGFVLDLLNVGLAR